MYPAKLNERIIALQLEQDNLPERLENPFEHLGEATGDSAVKVKVDKSGFIILEKEGEKK